MRWIRDGHFQNLPVNQYRPRMLEPTFVAQLMEFVGRPSLRIGEVDASWCRERRWENRARHKIILTDHRLAITRIASATCSNPRFNRKLESRPRLFIPNTKYPGSGWRTAPPANSPTCNSRASAA